MPEVTTHRPGSFCWVDLATTDAEGAKAFYAALFGWTAEDLPTPHDMPYTMLRKGGKDVCALFVLGPGMGDTPRWQGYVSVTEVDAAADSAEALGGKVIVEPMDVLDAGRMACIQDPAGAHLCLWQPGEHRGAALKNEAGAQSWLELQTRDTELAARFYGGLFGWTTKVSQSVMEGKYDIFVVDGEEVGGMLRIEDDWGPVPPHWAVYFGVESCDRTVESAVRLGGRALFPAMDIENIGRFAFLQDPQGAVFAVIQFAHPV